MTIWDAPPAGRSARQGFATALPARRDRAPRDPRNSALLGLLYVLTQVFGLVAGGWGLAIASFGMSVCGDEPPQNVATGVLICAVAIAVAALPGVVGGLVARSWGRPTCWTIACVVVLLGAVVAIHNVTNPPQWCF